MVSVGLHILQRKLPCKNCTSFLLFVILLACSNSYSFVIGPPTTPPVAITITSPTSASTYIATGGTIDIAGKASNGWGPVANVTWTNNLGGAGSVDSPYSLYNWNITGIVLKPGNNVITVSMYTALNSPPARTASLTVYMPLPTVSIASPTPNQRLSNPVFLARGTAFDFEQVGGVLYQLNDGDWLNATGTTNWSAMLELVPGTNTLSAYALDTHGNASITNNVTFDFVVTDQLNVRVFGLGKTSPNYSKARLEVGRNYTIEAVPSANFVFTNWVVSTNWIGGVVTYGKVLQFMMQSNLTIQVNFAETTSPKLAIKTPKNNQTLTSPLITVKGTASDIWGVSNVWYQINDGDWKPATTANNWKSWMATLPLEAGTNKINAYSVNLGGKVSPIQSVMVKSRNKFNFKLGLTSGKSVKSNGVSLELEASQGINGTIQVSTDMVHWSTLTNFVGSDSTIYFHDSAVTNSQLRFYRAVTPTP